jgi:hypothetical protein
MFARLARQDQEPFVRYRITQEVAVHARDFEKAIHLQRPRSPRDGQQRRAEEHRQRQEREARCGPLPEHIIDTLNRAA